MALEDVPGGDSLYNRFLFSWVLGRFLCGERFRFDRREGRQKSLNLSGGLHTSNEIMMLRGGRVDYTQRCLISARSKLDSKEQDPVLISFAIATGDERGMR
jgi:hypothetical protein